MLSLPTSKNRFIWPKAANGAIGLFDEQYGRAINLKKSTENMAKSLILGMNLFWSHIISDSKN
jgi:hypothetical protein